MLWLRNHSSRLPQMAFSFFSKINLMRITPVGLTDCPVKAICAFWHSIQMHMVGHQAVDPYFNAAFAAPLSHELDEIPVIAITEKSILSTISTLCCMMEIMLCDDSCNTCHVLLPYLFIAFCQSKTSMVSPDYHQIRKILGYPIMPKFQLTLLS